MSEKIRKGIVTVAVLVAAALAWQFGAKPRMPRYQSWEGVIKEPYRIRDVKKDVQSAHRAENLFYTHYWRVVCDDGKELDVELPYKRWLDAEPGQRVSKQSGKRWPLSLPMTEEDRQHALAKGYIRTEEPPSALEDRSDDQGKAFLADNAKKDGVTVLPSGLQYKVIAQGTGPSPGPTDSVKVDYRGTLINGDEFDSSYKRGAPATFALNGVIKGWTEALQLMNVGARWEIYVPAELAYGKKGPPGIGPNKVLVFEIELLDIMQ